MNATRSASVGGWRSLAAVAAILCGPSVVAMAAGISTFPFSDGFETSDPQTDPWSGGAGVTLVNSPTFAGAKACSVNNDTLILTNGLADQTSVWIRIYCKPVPYDDSSGKPVVSDCRAAFYLSDAGHLWAYTSGGWVDIASEVSKTDWLDFAVRLDYGQGTWDILWATGTQPSKTYDNPLLMSGSSPTAFAQMKVTSINAAYVDEVRVDRAAGTLTKGFASSKNVQLLASMKIARGMGAREIAKYFDSTSDGLTGPLGALLAKALAVGDKIRIYFPGTGYGSYIVYLNPLSDQLEWVRDGSSGPPPENVHITTTTGFFIDSTVTGTVTVDGFAPFTTTGPQENPGIVAGWNMFSWPHGTRLVNDGIGFTSPNAADRMYVYKPDGLYKKLKYVVGTGWTELSGSLPNPPVTLSEGQGLWYKAANGGTWAVKDL